MFLGDTRIGRDVRDVYAGILSLEGLAALFLVGLPVYLLGSLGLRVIAIPRILKELLRPGARTAQRTFLAAYVLLGLVVTLTCTVSSECGGGYNNAVWFWTQSKLVAWVFVVEIIWSALEGKGAAVRALVLGLVAALSIPSTVQQLAKQAARPMVVLDKNTVELVHFIERLCSHGEVVFAHESLARAIVTMTKCRVPLEERDCVLPAPEAEVKRRRRDLDDFWNTDSSDETRAEILHRYNTAYLVLEKKVNKLSPLPPPVVSRPLFENEDFVLYMVRKPK
jgi:hypothetical protein